MEDNRMLENISLEEYTEAMNGFDIWRSEVAETEAVEFEKWTDEMEAEFLKNADA